MPPMTLADYMAIAQAARHPQEGDREYQVPVYHDDDYTQPAGTWTFRAASPREADLLADEMMVQTGLYPDSLARTSRPVNE